MKVGNALLDADRRQAYMEARFFWASMFPSTTISERTFELVPGPVGNLNYARAGAYARSIGLSSMGKCKIAATIPRPAAIHQTTS